MLPQSLPDRELIKDIIEQRNQMSSMKGAEAYYMHEVQQKEEESKQLTTHNSVEKMSAASPKGSMGQPPESAGGALSAVDQSRLDANMVAGQAELKQNKSILFQPHVDPLPLSKNAALKRHGQSYTHRRHYNNSQLPYSLTNEEMLSHRQRVHQAAMERLSVGKLRVKAKLHQPNYVPKKEFGFRTINSPSKFKDIRVESVAGSKQSMPASQLQTDQRSLSVENMENLIMPDSFTASQKVQPLIN